MDAFRPEGLIVPLVTPFDEQGDVDLGALERLARDVLRDGASGIVALATTGEPTSLDAEERAAVVDVCASVTRASDAVLVVGAGTNDTRETIARHEALADVPGVTASLAVVPYYVRPSEAAIVRHFAAVADCSPVPVILYNIPYRTGRGLGAASLLELADMPNIAGLKQAVGALDIDTTVLLAEAADRFAVLGGDDAFLLPTVLMGGTGAIAASSNLCTDRFAAMIALGRAGRVLEARAHADALLPLVRALFAEPNPAVIKAVLHAEGRIPTPHVRMPLADASREATAAAVEALGLAKAVAPAS